MTGFVDPTKETFAQFRENDRPGPILMLNLVGFRNEAAYPDGRKATGAEAYAAYGRKAFRCCRAWVDGLSGAASLS